MRKDLRTTPEPVYYRLHERAVLALVETRDHLYLMARLTEPRSSEEETDVRVSPRALAALFDAFAADVDRVIVASRWPGRAARRAGRKSGEPPSGKVTPEG